ncbi:MAG: VWA domain-containing protein [Bacteroidetes bacterium]|nr:VWA domain-containing protein [Bacteroidota bacterium]
MYRFENKFYLFGLALIPVFILLYILVLQWKKKSLKKYGDISIITQLMPDFSSTRQVFKFILLLFAYFFLVIGLANPQIGSKLEKAKRKGVELIIALDVSNSMMAEDIKPNRLERAKQAISKLIDKFDNDKIGIIVFAGKAYTQLPITPDYYAAKMYLENISPGMIPVQGTAIGAAIEQSVNSFPKESKTNKAIIVITDGENHEDDAITASKAAADKGIIVHTIGMGLPEGAPIPLQNNNGGVDYKKDREGNTIITKLNETMLQQIAAAGKGIYVRATNTEAGLNTVFDEVNKMEKTEFDAKTFTEYEGRFQYFIFMSFLLIVFELMLSEKKSIWFGKLKIFEKGIKIS